MSAIVKETEESICENDLSVPEKLENFTII